MMTRQRSPIMARPARCSAAAVTTNAGLARDEGSHGGVDERGHGLLIIADRLITGVDAVAPTRVERGALGRRSSSRRRSRSGCRRSSAHIFSLPTRPSILRSRSACCTVSIRMSARSITNRSASICCTRRCTRSPGRITCSRFMCFSCGRLGDGPDPRPRGGSGRRRSRCVSCGPVLRVRIGCRHAARCAAGQHRAAAEPADRSCVLAACVCAAGRGARTARRSRAIISASSRPPAR